MKKHGDTKKQVQAYKIEFMITSNVEEVFQKYIEHYGYETTVFDDKFKDFETLWTTFDRKIMYAGLLKMNYELRKKTKKDLHLFQNNLKFNKTYCRHLSPSKNLKCLIVESEKNAQEIDRLSERIIQAVCLTIYGFGSVGKFKYELRQALESIYVSYNLKII